MQQRKVFILLTRFLNQNARTLGTLTGCYYTHASIGLEEDRNTFYSFVGKGFIVEKITRYLKPEREPFPCRLYELEVSEQVYQQLKEHLTWFEERKPLFRYTKLGVVMCVLRIPFRREHHYFCSQFVAEALMKCKAAQLRKDSSLYLPKDFYHLPELRLHFQGDMRSLVSQFIQTPSVAY